jgi:hypothetical protein
VAQAATHIWSQDPTGDEPPQGAEDPFEAILALRRWCARATTAQTNGPVGQVSPVTGARSRPMSKTQMMKALGLDSPKTFGAWATDKDLQPAGNRQTWTLDLTKLDTRTREKLERV